MKFPALPFAKKKKQRQATDALMRQLPAQRCDMAAVRAALADGADVNAVWGDLPAVHWCTQKDHVAAMALLLDGGANIEAPCENMGSPLISAAAHASEEMIALLVERGANMNAVDNKGRTALMWACHHDYAEKAEWLVHNGADLFIKDKDGKTAADIAVEKSSNNAVAVLRPYLLKQKKTQAEIEMDKLRAVCNTGTTKIIRLPPRRAKI